MAQFGEKAKAAGKSVEGVGKSLSKLSAVAIGAGTVAVKTFASYDDAIRQVYATMGLSESESTAEMKALSDAAQEMGASTRYSASEAASALNYLALAGYDSEKAIEALPTVLNLAQASGIDLASASDMVTDSMSALGLEMSYMPAFADQIPTPPWPSLAKACAGSGRGTGLRAGGEAVCIRRSVGKQIRHRRRRRRI